VQQFGAKDKQNDTEDNPNAFASKTAAHDPRPGLPARESGCGSGQGKQPIDFGHGSVAQKNRLGKKRIR